MSKLELKILETLETQNKILESIDDNIKNIDSNSDSHIKPIVKELAITNEKADELIKVIKELSSSLGSVTKSEHQNKKVNNVP